MTKLDKPTKSDLLDALEHIDRHFRPPRPTQQTANTLGQAIRQARNTGRVRDSLATVIEAAIKLYRDKLHRRRLAWNLANRRHKPVLRPGK